MGLKLKATNGGGSVELNVPDTVNSDLALTIPAAAGTIDRLERAGNIVQISHGATTTELDITNSGTTWVDTGVTTTLTTQYANSRFIIIASLLGYWTQSNANFAGGGYRIDRNGTALLGGPADPSGAYTIWHQSIGSTEISFIDRSTWTLRDSPGLAAGTSLTYKAQIQNYGASATCDFCEEGIESNIIVMEVAP